MKRQMLKSEWEEYEMIDVSTVSDETGTVYIKGFKKAEIPPEPDNIHVWKLKETTKLGDTQRSYIWIPVMIEET